MLIVEDEQAVRTLTRTILERAGYSVLDASTATDAEALFAQEAGGIDLVVTDIALPDGTGPALFKRLREKRPSLRVLYMSGYTDETLLDRAALEPAAGFCRSPFWRMDSSKRFAKRLIDDASHPAAISVP